MDDIYYEKDKIPKIDPDTLRRLSKLQPWRSFSAIVLDWLIIILCILMCEWVSYWLYPVAFILVGSRFHALEAMMHEATHYRLHPNKKANEVVGELMVWPLGLCVFFYRRLRHFAHHKSIGTVRDSHIHQSYEKHADRFTPKSFSRLVVSCLTVAIQFPGEVWLGQLFTTAKLLPQFSRRLGVLWISFQLITLSCIVLGSIFISPKIGWIYLLFFIAPLMWVAVFARYMRLLSEHFGIPGHEKNSISGSETRTVLVPWIIRVVFWPHNLNYHVEHHWYPSVPFYNLPALHTLLIGLPHAKPHMHITKGLKNLIKELTATPAG